MGRTRVKSFAALIDHLVGEASWLLSHAQALTDYGRHDEAAAELVRAANADEHVACLLEADLQEQEAAIHRVSAASSCEKLGQHARAVTLLHAALSASLPADYRHRVEQLLGQCLAKANEELKRVAAHKSRRRSSTAL